MMVRSPGWKKGAKRRAKAKAKKIDRANAEYDRLHGGAKVIIVNSTTPGANEWVR